MIDDFPAHQQRWTYQHSWSPSAKRDNRYWDNTTQIYLLLHHLHVTCHICTRLPTLGYFLPFYGQYITKLSWSYWPARRGREWDTSILFFIESALLVSIKLGILIITTTELRDFLYSFLRSSNLRRRKVYTDFKWVPSKNYWRHFGRYNWRNFLLF